MKVKLYNSGIKDVRVMQKLRKNSSPIYRSLCMLNTMGKIWEKLIGVRLEETERS